VQALVLALQQELVQLYDRPLPSTDPDQEAAAAAAAAAAVAAESLRRNCDELRVQLADALADRERAEQALLQRQLESQRRRMLETPVVVGGRAVALGPNGQALWLPDSAAASCFGCAVPCGAFLAASAAWARDPRSP
jgi:hypothetical protein